MNEDGDFGRDWRVDLVDRDSPFSVVGKVEHGIHDEPNVPESEEDAEGDGVN